MNHNHSLHVHNEVHFSALLLLCMWFVIMTRNETYESGSFSSRRQWSALHNEVHCIVPIKDSWRIPPTRALTMCHIHAIWVMAHHPHDSWYLKDSRLMIANTNLVPLLEGLCTSNPCRVDNRSLLQKSPVLLREGLCSSNPCKFECSVFGVSPESNRRPRDWQTCAPTNWACFTSSPM